MIQFKAIADCVNLGYFFFPLWANICQWFLSAISSADHSVSQSPWEVHTNTLMTHFGTWAGCQCCVCKDREESFASCSPSSFLCPLCHPQEIWSCTTLLFGMLIWHLCIMFKTGGHLCWSFIPPWWQIPEATPPAQQRNQLEHRQLTHGQDKAPFVSQQTQFIFIYRHLNILGRNGMEHAFLDKWAKLRRVESFPCKWWAFRHWSKVLGNQRECFQWRSWYSQRGSYWLWQRCISAMEPGQPRQGEEGANTDGCIDRRPCVIDWSCQTSGLDEQFTVPPEKVIAQTYLSLFTPFSVHDILGLLQIVFASFASTCRAECISCARLAELLSSVSVLDWVNL